MLQQLSPATVKRRGHPYHLCIEGRWALDSRPEMGKQQPELAEQWIYEA